jgi:hypothetical protein
MFFQAVGSGKSFPRPCQRAAPNQALEPTPHSVRSYVAPAMGRVSPRALGHSRGDKTVSEGQYVATVSSEDIEWERVGLLEAMCDGITMRYLDALGVSSGWRCIDVGAGRGSIARWLAERVGPLG